MADDLRIYRRQAAAAPPPVADVESDSESEDELDGPDTPSPTQTTFPTGISTSAPASTQTSTADLGNIGTDTLVVSSTTTSETTTNGAALSATSPTQNSQAQQSDVSQSTDQSGLMSRGGVIAMGLLSKTSFFRLPLHMWEPHVLTLVSWLGDRSHHRIRGMEVPPSSQPVQIGCCIEIQAILPGKGQTTAVRRSPGAFASYEGTVADDGRSHGRRLRGRERNRERVGRPAGVAAELGYPVAGEAGPRRLRTPAAAAAAATKVNIGIAVREPAPDGLLEEGRRRRRHARRPRTSPGAGAGAFGGREDRDDKPEWGYRVDVEHVGGHAASFQAQGELDREAPSVRKPREEVLSQYKSSQAKSSQENCTNKRCMRGDLYIFSFFQIS